MSNFTRQSQLVSCNPSLAMNWQMTYIHKLPKLCSATLMAHSFSKSGTCRPICLFLTQVDEDAASKTLQDLYSSKTKVKYLVKMFVINWTTSTPPFSLRDSRASKIRACVKITPCEKGDTRQRERKMRDYRQSSGF